MASSRLMAFMVVFIYYLAAGRGLFQGGAIFFASSLSPGSFSWAWGDVYKRQVEVFVSDGGVFLAAPTGCWLFDAPTLLLDRKARVLRVLGAVSYTHLDVYKRQP